MKVPVERIRRLLVIRPDHIGDLMLITPVLRSIKKVCPGVEITALIQAYTDPIACRIADIDHIIQDRLPRGRYTRQQFFEVLSDIRDRRFDMVIHFTTDYPYTFLTWLARIPYRVGDNARLGMRPWLNVSAYQHYRNTTLHEIHHNYDLCDVFSVPLSEEPMGIRVNADEIQQFKQKHGLNERCLVMHLGTGGGNKPWLPERFAQVADQIFQHHGIRALVVGSPSEQHLADRFFAAVTCPHINLIGKTDLADLPLAIACGDYFMGVDSGPMHLAAALGKPVVAIFPTKMVKVAHWGPWHVPQQIVRQSTSCELKCIPRDCPLTTCLEDQPVASVVAAFDQLVKCIYPQTPQEQHWQRVRRTLGIGIMAKTDSASVSSLAHQLRSEGFSVTVLDAEQYPAWSFRKIAQALTRYNLHVLIVDAQKPVWQLSALLTGLDVFIPPLVIGLQDVPSASSNYAAYLSLAFAASYGGQGTSNDMSVTRYQILDTIQP